MEAIIATVVFAVLSVVCFSVSMLMRREKYASIFAKANPVMPDGRLRYDPQKRLRSGSILLLIYGIVFLITAAAVLLTKVWVVLPNACALFSWSLPDSGDDFQDGVPGYQCAAACRNGKRVRLTQNYGMKRGEITDVL